MSSRSPSLTVWPGSTAGFQVQVDSGPLDMLEESRDEDVRAVADRVDIDLDPFEIAVDADRPVGVHDGRRRQLADEVVR